MKNMVDVVVVDAVRTPTGRRGGAISGVHPIDLLGKVQAALFERTGVEPSQVGQVVGGCVGQVGAQTMNITRTAWLAAGLPLAVPALTIDAQCGSSQQATTIAHCLIASGIVGAVVACGVEAMSTVSMGATIPKDPFVGKPVNRNYRARYELTSQFEGAERIAEKWGISRRDADAFGKLSQDRAAQAWEQGRFDTQLVPVEIEGADDAPAKVVDRDEGVRSTTLEGLASLKPTGRPDGVHTAATSSQIADGAAAVLLMRRDRAEELGLPIMAQIVDSCLVGCDPVLMLEGPIPATRTLLARNGMSASDIDLVEINEAFASVVLAWLEETKVDVERVNPNGGAIAIGHPLGATGAMLIAKAVHELQRSSGEVGLVTMCCGGGLGTGTLLRRI
jgi:acetyl-CoA C-acetyltransferase